MMENFQIRKSLTIILVTLFQENNTESHPMSPIVLISRYCRQVTDETIRCCVIAPWAARYADYDLQIGEHIIPKKVYCNVLLFLVRYLRLGTRLLVVAEK